MLKECSVLEDLTNLENSTEKNTVKVKLTPNTSLIKTDEKTRIMEYLMKRIGAKVSYRKYLKVNVSL